MIKFENVNKNLGGKRILKDINLHIKKGELFALVGPSGTGKSVLLRHIIGLHNPTSGKVIVDNMDIAKLSKFKLEKYRANCGVLFQSGALLNWMTVEDNVALPLIEKTKLSAKEITEKSDEALDMLGLLDDRYKMPSEISGGMKKRVGLARAIVTNPDIILYDEPTSGLDPIMSRKIDELILSLKEKLNITSVVVTHDMQTALTISDRVAMINQGEIIEVSTPKDFLNTNNKTVQAFTKAYGQFSI